MSKWAEKADRPNLPPRGKEKSAPGSGRDPSGMVSYEDLLIAQYLEELRKAKGEMGGRRQVASPYKQRLSQTAPHSQMVHPQSGKRRPMSASVVGRSDAEKPKIDAKFIADPNIWDPATPRMQMRNRRPASAPAKRRSRPPSAYSAYSYGRSRNYWPFPRPVSGRRVKSLYKKQPSVIRVTAYRNGNRERFIRLASPSMKVMLEMCTDKLAMPFAARRVFLEDATEIFDAADIPLDGEIFISMGENFTDPDENAKRNLILRNGAKWSLTGVVLPEDGKKKTRKSRMSKRMRSLIDKKCVRIVVFRNGKSTEPIEVVADLNNIEEFLVACTSKLDLRSYARILYDWEGTEITYLPETPILHECLQQGGTPVLGPLWISTGEGFSPSGTLDFLISIRSVVKAKLKNAKRYKKELTYAKEEEKEKVTITHILSLSDEEMYEALDMADSEIDQLTETLQRIEEKIKNISDEKYKEESQGPGYRLSHIKELDVEDRLVGQKGLRLKVYENGLAENEQVFFFNVRGAQKGLANDRARLLQRLLDDLSSCHFMANPQTPKLAPSAKKVFDKFGHEITDVSKLEYDQEIWVSFGEPFVCPFAYCVQTMFDSARGVELEDDRLIVLREQLMSESTANLDSYKKWEASAGFPSDCNRDKSDSVSMETLMEMGELDANGHYLQCKEDPDKVLYPEVVVHQKLPKGHKELWPSESQVWIISKNGYIFCKPMPQLCLAVTDLKITTRRSDGGSPVEGFVVSLQKKAAGNAQTWQFNNDATISCTAYPDLVLTYLGNKFGDEDEPIPENTKPGNKVFLLVSDKLSGRRETTCQRFALKQERFDNLGQWKFTDSSNPEWNKQAYSWPTREDGTLNEDYDWPMEGYLVPNAPPLRKSGQKNSMSGMTPLRLMVVKNGERDLNLGVPIVGPNLTNMLKDLQKNKPKQKGSKGHEKDMTVPADAIEVDINLHCRELTIRELEFIMFLDHCTSMLNLPFAARRMFDERGKEHYNLANLKRDQVVYVSCGEVWTDPQLTRAEQQRRYLLSQLSSDVGQIRQFCALRNPEKYVLEISCAPAPNVKITVNRQWNEQEEQEEEDRQAQLESESVMSSLKSSGQGEDTDDLGQQSAHEKAHLRSEQRLNNLKWPWERLLNASNSFDFEDPEAQKYTDKEMYEKFKPKHVPKISRDTLQRFVYEDGYIACVANRNLVLGVLEQEGRVNQVMLVKRRPDEINQRWVMKETGEIRSKYNQKLVLTVAMPTQEQLDEDIDSEDRQVWTFSGCAVTLQARRANQYGKAHQRWHYDAETGFIHGFYSNLPDKEITAANKADVCTYAIAGTTKIDQPGYVAEVPLQTVTDKGSVQSILVCTSCARAMRGRFKLQKLPDNTKYNCAMGDAKKLKLQQIGSFRVLNGKVDLSTHEALLTLEKWEDKLQSLREKTSVRTIAKEINAAITVRTVKVLGYKNGEGRLRPGEIVCGSSIEGILSQCTHRLGLNNAARRIYTEDGTLILEIDDLVDWAVNNYQQLLADEVERLLNGKELRSEGEEVEGEDNQLERGEGEGQDSPPDEQSPDDAGADEAATDDKEADKVAKRREFMLSQVTLPSIESILRYPIEVWVSSGKPFVAPEVVESKVENRKKKRAFRSAVSLELDMEKHILRQMRGRRIEEQSPGEYISTRNTNQPVVKEGHWQDLTVEEEMKHDTVHRLETHLAEVRKNQNEELGLCVNTNKRLYQQPNMKRVQVYPNGESIERTVYVWGETLDQILDRAATKLNMWQRAKSIYNMEGRLIENFDDISRDELLCVSAGKRFTKTQSAQQDIEVKANWSRARKQYGEPVTDLTVEAAKHPKVNVDPYGPPELALPLNDGTSMGTGASRARPVSAKPKS